MNCKRTAFESLAVGLAGTRANRALRSRSDHDDDDDDDDEAGALVSTARLTPPPPPPLVLGADTFVFDSVVVGDL